MVMARHLHFFGHKPSIHIVAPLSSDFLVSLRTLCERMQIPILSAFPSECDDAFDAIVDAVFGFSFTPRALKHEHEKCMHF